MSAWTRSACAGAVFAVLAACAQLPGGSREGPVFTTAESRALLALLDGYARWQTMPAEEQKREFAAANDAYQQAAGDAGRLRLALLLSMPNGAVRDDARALTLLEPLVAGNATAAGPLRDLAQLLYAQLAERGRALRDEQRRSEDLAQKLDALRKLERSLIEREQRARPK